MIESKFIYRPYNNKYEKEDEDELSQEDPTCRVSPDEIRRRIAEIGGDGIG